MNAIRTFNGKTPRIAAGVWIDPSAVIIGEVSIGTGASIWPGSVVRGDIHRIEIGERTNVQDGSVLHVTHDSTFNPGGYPLIIGNDITIGHRVTLHGCTLHDHCLIGMNCTVLDGVVIESDVLLAAGSLVPPGKRLTAGQLWRGSPAVAARALTDREKEQIRYITRNYVRLAEAYAQESKIQ